jgi:hypothetical protein
MTTTRKPPAKAKAVRKWYVSGPMTGLPKFNFPAFDAVTEHLKASGGVHDIVFSPAENDRVHWAKDGLLDVEEQAYFIDGDVAAYAAAVELPVVTLYRDDFNFIINEATDIVLLPGWEKSTGARYELVLAEALGIGIWLAVPQCEEGDPVEDAYAWSLVEGDPATLTTHLRIFQSLPEQVEDRKPEFSMDVPPIENYSVRELIAAIRGRVGHIPLIASELNRIESCLG